jgi:hypothetical protein
LAGGGGGGLRVGRRGGRALIDNEGVSPPDASGTSLEPPSSPADPMRLAGLWPVEPACPVSWLTRAAGIGRIGVRAVRVMRRRGVVGDKDTCLSVTSSGMCRLASTCFAASCVLSRKEGGGGGACLTVFDEVETIVSTAETTDPIDPSLPSTSTSTTFSFPFPGLGTGLVTLFPLPLPERPSMTRSGLNNILSRALCSPWRELSAPPLSSKSALRSNSRSSSDVLSANPASSGCDSCGSPTSLKSISGPDGGGVYILLSCAG